ncbi:hypothetical protein EVAR_95198_1 [Eumeta japonica]|uniref:Uncharacterized protein n=1 Tax=Eumeta variegata TaxID=151549 RepID=A0A4C1VHV6_EUMVA|nr:hypothetical protein EVAR_95198_1 [Eumeta japonica]
MPLGERQRVFRSDVRRSENRIIYVSLPRYFSRWRIIRVAFINKGARITQRAKGGAVVGISLRDRIRGKTTVIDVADRISKLKWYRTGHVIGRTDERRRRKISSGDYEPDVIALDDLALGGATIC